MKHLCRLSALGFALVVSGCATLDRSSVSRFEMVTDTSWKMWARTASNYAPDSERAEAIRMSWIQKYVEANGCKTYQIVDRRWTKEPTDNFMQSGFSSSVGELAYTGTCVR